MRTAKHDASPVVRNVRFELDRVPRYWHGGRRSITLFFNNLSVFFPPGERFFVASVKAYRHCVDDPALLEDVKTFCAQEAFHGREHVRYNRMLQTQGYPADEMERRVERLIADVSKRLPKRWQLAGTCALEHFTALMAHLLLRDPRALEGADATMSALWRWHAAEENEHKAVAFEVYRRSGGNYAERSFVMLLVSAIFWSKVLEHQVRLMRSDGSLFSPKEWASLIRFLVLQPGSLRDLVGPYLQYFKPDFHPWDLDNRGLLETWKREFASSMLYKAAA